MSCIVDADGWSLCCLGCRIRSVSLGQKYTRTVEVPGCRCELDSPMDGSIYVLYVHICIRC